MYYSVSNDTWNLLVGITHVVPTQMDSQSFFFRSDEKYWDIYLQMPSTLSLLT